MPVARPTSYTKNLGDKICARLAEGESLRAICLDKNMPDKTTVYRWRMSEDEAYNEFRTQYALAREIQYESMGDEIMDIADDGTNDYVLANSEEGDLCRVNPEAIGRSRLRVETRKWFMSKVLPKFRDKPEENPANDMATVLQSLIDRLPS